VSIDGHMCPVIYSESFTTDNKSCGESIIPINTCKYHSKLDIFITSSKNVYKLGQPHPDYEAKFPNAKELFLNYKKNNHGQETQTL
jgi:hypothetical protein